MESARTEIHMPSRTVSKIRDRIVSVHERHLKVVPMSEKAVDAFEDVARSVRSEKAKAAVERLRPRIRDIATAFEVSSAGADLVVGVTGAAVGIDGIVGGIMEKRRINAEVTVLDTSMRSEAANTLGVDLRKRVVKGMKGAGVAGLFLGVRPVTRLAYYAGIPLARRAALTVDNILLRREQTLKPNEVLVGSSKA